MTVRKDSSRDVWFYRFSKDGKNYSEYGFATKADAKEAERKKENEAPNPKGPAAEWPFNEAVEWHLSTLPPSKKTADIDKGRLGLAARFFGDIRVSEIRIEDVEEFLDKLPALRREATPRIKKLSDQTRNHYLAMLRALYNRMRKRGKYTGENPTLQVSFISVAKARVRFLYPSEKKLLTPIAMNDPVLWPYFFMALHTGCRIGELMAMRIQDIDLTLSQIFIPNSKNHKSRHVPLSPNTVEFVRKLVGERSSDSKLLPNWSYTYLRSRFQNACDAAGIKNLKIHDCRHSFAQHLLSKGESIYKVSKIMGHSSIKVTEAHYGHMAIADLALTIAKIDGICEAGLQKKLQMDLQNAVSELGNSLNYQQFSAG